MKNKIVIIGCGNVGMSYAYALLNQKTKVNELVLIDLDEKKVEGEVMDLNHSLAFAPSKIDIKVGSYNDCSNAAIVCITAGINQKPGETRNDLIIKNSKIIKTIVEKVIISGFKGIFLVATNPLDIITYLVWKYSKFKPNKIIGSGTSLDTARLRFIISAKLKINTKNVHAYVVGEHGDTEFVPWSSASIGLQSIYDYLNDTELDNIEKKVKMVAYEIIDRKGATCYGIGMCLVRITDAILNDENSILTVSTYDDKLKIFIGLPSIINKHGIKRKLDIKLNKTELIKWNKTINKIKRITETFDL